MIPSDTDGVLQALGGLHPPTVGEKLGVAFATFWISLAGCSVILGIFLGVGGAFAGAKNTAVSILYGIGYLGSYVLAGVWAYREATTVYGFDSTGIRTYPGWPFRGWSVPRSHILEARVVRGTSQWTLDLTLPNGKEKRLVLSASMRRALGIQ
jgi:hypothetical protein